MKRIFSILWFLSITIILFGQNDPKENFYDAEFYFAEEDYEEALNSFIQVYRDGYEDNANINYRIGVCLLNIEGRKTEAIPYLKVAVENLTNRYKEGSFKEVLAPFDALLYLANAYRINYELDKAIEYYNKFLENDVQGTNLEQYAKLQIGACEKMLKNFGSEGKYSYASLGQLNDIQAPIFNIAVSGDLNTIAFMGKHKFYNGVYYSKKENGVWNRPLNITPTLQSDGNQNVLFLSNDGNTLLLNWFDQFDGEIYISEYKNNYWRRSEAIGKPINSKYYESHACLTPDGKSIYFTSNRKESIGEMDIFKCDRQSDGSWGDLITLDVINTKLSEETPYVSPDGKRLYFSSQGHEGLGGFDIFYSEIGQDGSLGKPVNLDYPLNTSDDDFLFSPEQIIKEDAITVYAKDGTGEIDLYTLDLIPKGIAGNVIPFEIKEEQVDIPVKEPLALVVIPGEVTAEPETVETVEEVQVDEVTEVTEPEAVEEVVTEEVATKEEAIPLEVVEKVYLIKPVFFDFDSYALTKASKTNLDDLASVLNKFSEIKLEITGHTDAIGTDEYNLSLSKKRAESVLKYLVGQGVDKARLEVKAMGEREHIARNRTVDNRDAPKGRALNRRVEFIVKYAGKAKLEVEKIEVPSNLQIDK